MKIRLLALLLVSSPCVAAAQSLDLGVNNVGLSIGNSREWTGVRINWRDNRVREVNGLNITLWKPIRNPDFRMNGIALGLFGPEARTITGAAIGVGGVVAHEDINGIALAGLGVVAQGNLSGFTVAGLGVVSQGNMEGLNLAGLGTVAQGNMAGINVSGLGTVSQGRMIGINVSGLGTVAQGDMSGLNLAGLGVVSQGSLTGISISGLGTVAERNIRGINLAGLGVVAQGEVMGISASGLGTVGIDGVHGVALAGLGVVAAEGDVIGLAATLGQIETRNNARGLMGAVYRLKTPGAKGVAVTGVMNTVRTFDGIAIGGYNEFRSYQRGLAIGLVNNARRLRGVQIGLLNHAGNNPPGLRWLPLLNLHF